MASRRIFIIGICCLFNYVYGQDGSQTPAPSSVLPPSPIAATFQRYGDYPVSYATGLSEIKIPLYDIKENQYSFPIDISYHASGRNTALNLSPLGIGWALNASGIISREVRGRPDQLPSQNPPYPFSSIATLHLNYPAVAEMSFDNPSVQDTSRDSQYDIFTFNINGKTGKFIIVQGQPLLLTTEPYKIQVLSNAYIKLTDDQGVSYLFGNQSGDVFGGVEYSMTTGSASTIGQYNSSWFLNTLTTSFGQQIKFKYGSVVSQSGASPIWGNASVIEQYVFNDVGPLQNYQYTHINGATSFADFHMSYIKEIDFSNGMMFFNYDSALKLTSCNIQNNAGNRILGYGFSYQTLSGEDLPNNNSELLDTIFIKDSTGYTSEKYDLTYDLSNPVTPPNWDFAEERDWWGYYNGVTAGNVPNFNVYVIPQGSGAYYQPIGNSSALAPSFKAKEYAMLRKITFPTGGNTQFIYEPNKYFDSSGSLTQGPGLRIQQIISDDGMGNRVSKVYKYGVNENGAGTLLYLPDTNDFSTEQYNVVTDTNASYYYRTRIYQSQPNPSIAEAYSYPIYYQQVDEYQSDANSNLSNGKTVYTFTLPKVQITHIPIKASALGPHNTGKITPVFFVPFIQPETLSKTIYESANNAYYKLSEDDFSYGTFDSTNVQEIFMDRYINYLPNDPGRSTETLYTTSTNYEYPTYLYGPVYVIAGARRVLTQTHTDFTNGGQMLSYTKKYQYGNLNHLYPTTITTTDSKGGIVQTSLKYAPDYLGITATDSVSAGISALNVLNAISNPVEKSVYRSNADGSNSRLISSTFTAYKSAIPVPSVANATEINAPSTTFTPSSVQNGAISIDGSYKPQHYFDSYGSIGNLLQMHKASSTPRSYIWDYGNSYPIAEIFNAAQSDVAYTSFEADGSGNWSIFSSARDSLTPAITGYKSYVLGNGAISKAGLTSSLTYTISYWTRNSSPYTIAGTITGYPIVGRTFNGWTYYEHKVTGVTSVTISGTNNIDELRLYPSTAEMSSYTYTPLVGETSQCDPASRITYYRYDSIGRLSDVIDQYGDIEKKIYYSYYQGGGNATLVPIYANVTQIGTFTRNNCDSGMVGSQIIYTVPAGTYISTLSQSDADQQATNAVSAYGQSYANWNGKCSVPVPTDTIKLVYSITGITSTSAITVAFKQGSNVVTTTSFPRSQSGPFNVIVPTGTYQLTFTMPSAYSGHNITFTLNNTGQSWSNDGAELVVNSDSISFSNNTTYTITASGQ